MKPWIGLALLTLWIAGCNRTPSASSADATSKEPVATPTPTPRPPTTVAEPSDEQLPRALALKSEGKIAEARVLLQQIAAGTDPSEKTLTALGELDTQILFTPTPAPEKVEYTVEAGDSLDKIARRLGTTVELIKKSNGLTRDMIRVGDRLRVYQGHFAVEVNKTANTLTVTDNSKFFKRYRVGTGQFSKTPEGEFKITSRIENPPWYRTDDKTIPYGDPDNILGTHWLGLNVPGYGIHGTWDTNSIGKQSSAGCVRLLNDDVAELYTVLPVGTPVTIHE